MLQIFLFFKVILNVKKKKKKKKKKKRKGLLIILTYTYLAGQKDSCQIPSLNKFPLPL